MRYSLLSIIALAAAASACDAPARHAVAATSATSKSSSVSVPNAGVIPGTPEGDLDRWVKEMRHGIADVPALMKTDPMAAQTLTMNLYATRQEYTEMYYGQAGRLRGNNLELASAISEAEQRFHELLKLVAAKNPPAADVKAAVNALEKQHGRVLKLWKKAGTYIQRPAK